jgi:hypothetical protein
LMANDWTTTRTDDIWVEKITSSKHLNTKLQCFEERKTAGRVSPEVLEKSLLLSVFPSNLYGIDQLQVKILVLSCKLCLASFSNHISHINLTFQGYCPITQGQGFWSKILYDTLSCLPCSYSNSTTHSLYGLISWVTVIQFKKMDMFLFLSLSNLKSPGTLGKITLVYFEKEKVQFSKS